MLVCARRWVLALLAACSVCNVSGLVFHKSVAGTLNNSTQAVAIGAFTANASLLSIVATTVVNFDQSVYNFVPTAGYSDYTKSSLCTHCVSASAMMVTADIDGDGFLDIVSADEADGIVLWYKNINGTGNFSVNTVATSVSGVTGLAVGDMNNDGLLDIISSARYGEPSGQVNAHLQTRTSSNITWFTTLIGDTNAPTDLTVIDFNNDGLLDVLVASFGDANIQILLQEENYGFAFTPVIVVDTCQDPTGVSAGDIDGDGILDVAATCGGANQVVWAANDGELKFITTLVSTNSFNARQVTIVDLDLDGRKDLLVAVNINSTLSWFRNLGSGTSFEEITLSNTLYGIWSFALGDIDGNGGLDIVTASLYYNQLTVFLQDAPSPSTTPSVTPTPSATPSVTPSAAPGSCVDGVCPANSFKFVTTAWSACGSACGGGVSFRNAYCTDGLGRISPDPGPCLSQGGMPSTVQRCNSQACAALYWVPNTHWGACSHACDDGTGNSLGISTRTAPTCYNGSHTVAPDATTGLTPCDSQAGLVRPSTTQSCNRFPCPAQVFSWNTTAWSACAALATTGCGPTIGMRSRTVTCSSSANTRATGVLCPSPQPAANETCIITRPCACSNNTDCGGGNFACVSGLCKCATGWAGAACHLPDLAASAPVGAAPCATVVDVNHNCCPGAVDANNATCCASASSVTDINGACCESGVLDGCGLCDGAGVAMDYRGVCCSQPLSPSGLCCAGDAGIDSCGACEGVNNCAAHITIPVNSSSKQVSFTSVSIGNALGVPPATVSNLQWSQSHSRLLGMLQHGARVLQPSNMYLTFQLSGLATAATPVIANGVSRLAGAAVPVISRTAVCGNKICEFGEQCVTPTCLGACLVDCPLAYQVCPSGMSHKGNVSTCSGNGNCATTSGTCSCYPGYGGTLCAECAANYVQLKTNGPCVYMPGAFATCTDGILNGNEKGVDCGGPNCPNACPGSANITALIVKGSILGVVGLLVGTVTYFVVCKRRLVTLPKILSKRTIDAAAATAMHKSQIVPEESGRRTGRQSVSEVVPWGEDLPPVGNRKRPDIL